MDEQDLLPLTQRSLSSPFFLSLLRISKGLVLLHGADMQIILEQSSRALERTRVPEVIHIQGVSSIMHTWLASVKRIRKGKTFYRLQCESSAASAFRCSRKKKQISGVFEYAMADSVHNPNRLRNGQVGWPALNIAQVRSRLGRNLE